MNRNFIRCLTSKTPLISFVRNCKPQWERKRLKCPPPDIIRTTDEEKYPYDYMNPFTKKPKPDDEKIEVEVSREEWKYVEKILPTLTVPLPKNVSSTDWRPPPEKPPNLPYFISRNKNHMLPVYVKDMDAGTRRFTKLRRIQGDIWALERDLKKYLEEKHKTDIGTQVMEPMGRINFKGDFGEDVKEWLYKLGF